MDHRKSGESTSVSPGHGAEQKAFEDVPLQDLGNGGTRDVEANSNSSTLVPEAGDAQAGVQKIEAISMTWTKWGLIAAYASIFLMAFATSLEGQVVQTISVFATSSFNNHSLIATVYVVQGVVNAVVKTPMAKVADVFGRFEAFTFSVFLYVCGYIQMAASSNVQTYAAAQIFYSAGDTGLQILQQVFIADTSDLTNRALWSTLPDLPFLVTVWIGSYIGNAILATTTWRWGYGIWCIILPVTFCPLVISLFLNARKAKKLNLTAPRPWAGLLSTQVIHKLWSELDIGGILLLSAAFALILIPLTVASKASNGWGSADIIAMIVIGVVCLSLFPFWESSKKLAPRPLIPLFLFKSKTFCAGCAIGFFYFVAYYLSIQPYFYSYLLVVQNESVTAAGHVIQVFSFTSTIASLSISVVIKCTKHFKYFITIGSLIYIMGLGLMTCYRTQSSTIAQIVATQIAVGIGGGFLNVPAQLAVQASADHQHVAVATAVYLTCVELGGAVGSALSGALWGHFIPQKLTQYLPAGSKQDAQYIYNSIDVALKYAVGTPERAAISRAYQETMTLLLICAVIFAVPTACLSLLLKNYRLDKLQQGVKGRVIGGNVDGEEEVLGGKGEEGRDVEGAKDEDGVKEGEDASNRWSNLGSWLQRPKSKKESGIEVPAGDNIIS